MTKRPNFDELPPEPDVILRYLERKQCKISQGGGSHVKATSPVNGLCVIVPAGHGGSGRRLPVGTYRAILKQIIAMGLAVLILAMIVSLVLA